MSFKLTSDRGVIILNDRYHVLSITAFRPKDIFMSEKQITMTKHYSRPFFKFKFPIDVRILSRTPGMDEIQRAATFIGVSRDELHRQGITPITGKQSGFLYIPWHAFKLSVKETSSWIGFRRYTYPLYTSESHQYTFWLKDEATYIEDEEGKANAAQACIDKRNALAEFLRKDKKYRELDPDGIVENEIETVSRKIT